MREFSDAPYGLIRTKADQPVLYIVRHGSTGDDDSYNSPENPPLTEQGREDAKAAAKFLADKNIGNLLTSIFDRSKETAEFISQATGVKPQADKAIDSLDVGDVSKLSTKEEADKVIKHHQTHKDKPIPGGESIQNFHNRVFPQFTKSIQNFYKTGKPSVLSAHHSVQHAAGEFFNNDKDSALTKTGGVVAVYQIGPGRFKAVPVFRPEKSNG
jgi:broad specificity phosphatase PhoE